VQQEERLMTIAAPPAIVTAALAKDYGGVRGLVDLDLEVRAGEVFGFLGPNGAGKTTTIRLLMGMLRPTGGSARIFELDCWWQAVAIKQRIGYVPGELPDWGRLRGREITAHLAGLRGGVDPSQVASLCERLDLDLGRRWGEYSRGNKQKLALLMAFMHRPELLILDEPTGGLDPLKQQVFYQLVRDARASGATVFLSSHLLAEAEHVCDRVGIVRAGRLVTVATLDELRRLRAYQVEIEFTSPPPTEAVRAAADVEQVVATGNRLSCMVRGSFQPLLAAIAGHEVLSLASQEPSLEELFLDYYRDDEVEAPPRASPTRPAPWRSGRAG
jgi:ABC-2 type transport system ATP-binding protein